MHNLVIDIGNTNSKVAVFRSRTLVHFESLAKLDIRRIAELLDTFEVSGSTVSSVSDEQAAVIALLKARTRYIEFSTRSNPGIKNHYTTLSTLGLDRWAKVIAAQRFFPGEAVFMIDAGTCITYDLLNEQAEYFGGSISLGIKMRFQALQHFTGRLPLVEWKNENMTIPEGSDTNKAIQRGVLQGVAYEVEGFIAQQFQKDNKVKVLITGGDAAFFMNQLKDCKFADQVQHEPYLVLKGLNEVIAFEYVQKN
ncbi:type III pantothenate kinase [Pedobacter sp.]|uniref:type III pantothenate kinase n=1 Tax=Pedobacter sp. TaxID=1411316 RepID=UPI003D7FFC6E